MNFIDQITNYIIRPTRERYHINRLGPKQIYLPLPLPLTQPQPPSLSLPVPVPQQQQQPYPYISIFRDDYQLLTPHNKTLFYSYYTNHMTPHPDLCIVYLHANNGSRVEGLHYLEALLRERYNVCLMDCGGSGWSQGEFVTLGVGECEDLEEVCRHMGRVKGVRRVGLWGRSMGACTAIMYASKYARQNGNIVAMVLDSPFKDLRKLVKETSSYKTGLPQFFFQPILSFVDSEIHKKIGHSFADYNMQTYLPPSSPSSQSAPPIPALFVASQSDKLVKSHHIQELYNLYPGQANVDKFLYYIPSQHHEDRDQEMIGRCVGFLGRAVGRAYAGDRDRDRGYGGTAMLASMKINGNGAVYGDQRVVEPKFSFKMQDVIKLEAERILNADVSPMYPAFQPKPDSTRTAAMLGKVNSPTRKIQISKQKRRRPGIQLTQKLPPSRYPPQSQPQHQKRLSFQTSSRNQQRINLSKNTKFNNSFNDGLSEIRSNVHLSVDGSRRMDRSVQRNINNIKSVRMIESFKEPPRFSSIHPSRNGSFNVLAGSPTKKINLSDLKSPRDKSQQYYSVGSNYNIRNNRNNSTNPNPFLPNPIPTPNPYPQENSPTEQLINRNMYPIAYEYLHRSEENRLDSRQRQRQKENTQQLSNLALGANNNNSLSHVKSFNALGEGAGQPGVRAGDFYYSGGGGGVGHGGGVQKGNKISLSKINNNYF